MKNILRKLDIPLLLVSLILLALGLVMVFSSSSIAAVLQYNQTEYYFFKKQAIVMIGGLVLAFFVLFIKTKNYSVLSRLFIIGVIGALLALRVYGTVTNSAKSWFRIVGFSLQPSEFAKTFIILYLACVYGNRKKFAHVADIFIPLVPCVIIFGLVLMEPDMGTAAIIAFICMFIFFSLPVGKNRIMFGLRIFAIACGIGAIFMLQNNLNMLTESQASRLHYKEPCKRYLEETGYQVCNGYIAIHNGGLWGVGLGKSTQKYLYLPEAHTDFIFPIIVEELGLVGGGTILLLYLILLYRILVIARNATSLRGSIIAFGTFGYIFTHIVVNMGGLLALIPLTGVPLPFLSYGGSFMLNLLILLALTQRVAIESKEDAYRRDVKRIVGGKA